MALSSLFFMVMAALFLTVVPVSVMTAGPPIPDEYSESEEEPLDEDIIEFGDDYIYLISELNIVLEEFEKYFAEIGMASLARLSKDAHSLRNRLMDRYSSEEYEEMQEELEGLIDDIEGLREEMDEEGSRLNRQYSRKLRAFERDLQDLQEELNFEMIDLETDVEMENVRLDEVINAALEQAIKALEEAQKVHFEDWEKIEKSHGNWFEVDEIEDKEGYEIPEVPEVPELDIRIQSPPTVTSIPKGIKGGWFTDSKDMVASTTVGSSKIPIEIINPLGEVTVVSTNSSEIRAELTINYSLKSSDSRDFVDDIMMQSKDETNLIRIEVLYPSNKKEKALNIISSSLLVYMPADNPLIIKNSFGPVGVSDLNDDLSISSDFGDINIQNIDGDVDIAASNCTIYGENIDGDITVNNSFGSIELALVNGDINLTNSYAPITVNKSSGEIQIKNSGAVVINRCEGDAVITSSNGEMEIYDLEGSLDATNSFSLLRAERIDGSVKVANTNASIELSEINGTVESSNRFGSSKITGVDSDVSVISSNGTLTIEDINGFLEIKNDFGTVVVRDVEGPVTINNSNSPVSVTDVEDDVSVKNGFGTVVLEDIEGHAYVRNSNASIQVLSVAGPIDIATSNGSITAEDIGDQITILNKNGAVEILNLRDINTDSRIFSSYGNISVSIPRSATFNISAQASGGSINSDLSLVEKTQGNISFGELIRGKSYPTLSIMGQNARIEIIRE